MPNTRNGFSLLELLMVVLIIGIFSLVGVWLLFGYYGKSQVGNNVTILEQAIRNAKRLAQSKSTTIYLDLSNAGTPQDSEAGGILEIKDSDGAILDTVSFGKNVVVDLSSSTVGNNRVSFNYEGSPVDISDNVDGITSSNNTIVIGYQGTSGIVDPKIITVEPVTGNIQQN